MEQSHISALEHAAQLALVEGAAAHVPATPVGVDPFPRTGRTHIGYVSAFTNGGMSEFRPQVKTRNRARIVGPCTITYNARGNVRLLVLDTLAYATQADSPSSAASL